MALFRPYEVRQNEAVILERFGKFNTVKDKPGLKFILPGQFLKVAARIDLKITEHEIPLETKTKDNMFVKVPTVLHLQVCNPRQFHYNSDNPYRQAGNKITAAMKQLTNDMELDHVYQARETLGDAVREKVGAELEEKYGLKIIDVIINQPVVPEEVQRQYNSAKASEQTAKATMNAAKANKQAAIMDAEARKEALRLDGEGVAEQRAAMFQNLTRQFNALVQAGMPQETAEKILIKMMELDTLRDVAKSGNVIVTTTADKDPISDMQAAVRAANATQKPQQPPQP